MMRSTLALTLALAALATPAMAKDDGGFGTSHFTGTAPVALQDNTPVDANVAATGDMIAPNDMEPAAGVDDMTVSPTDAAGTAPAMKAPELPAYGDQDEGLYQE